MDNKIQKHFRPNHSLKYIGDIKKINLKFEDVDINLDAEVTKVNKKTAMLTFTNMSVEIANKLIYNRMKKACAK